MSEEKRREITPDTIRAMAALEPLLKELNIACKADGDYLTLNGQEIGIGCNSTWATIMEAIGYIFDTQYLREFRCLEQPVKQKIRKATRRYWTD